MHRRAYVCTREKVLPASLLDRESAKKFALRAQIGPNSAFLRLLGEFFRGRAGGGAVLGEFCRGRAAGGAVPGEFFRAKRPCAGLGGDAAHFRLVAMGGFALHEALLRRVAGVSNPRVVQFPPIGGGAAASRGGVAPTSQTTSVKNADNGLLVVKWSAFWANRHPRGVLCA